MESEKHKTVKNKGEKEKWKKLFKFGKKKKIKKDHEGTIEPTKWNKEIDSPSTEPENSDPDLTTEEENIDNDNWEGIHAMEQNRKICALQSYIKDLQNEIASLKAEFANYKEKVHNGTITKSEGNDEDTLKNDISVASVKQEGEEATDDQNVEINQKEVPQSREYYSNQLAVLESELASLRERLQMSEQGVTSKSKECEELKEGLDRATNKLITAERQISVMVEKDEEIDTQGIIDKMKVDYEAAIEEERKNNKELNNKLQAAMSRNRQGKEQPTASCFPCLQIACCKRLKAQYLPGAPNFSPVAPK